MGAGHHKQQKRKTFDNLSDPVSKNGPEFFHGIFGQPALSRQQGIHAILLGD